MRLVEWGAEVDVWDDGEVARRAAEEAGLTLHNPTEGPFRADALLLSPGIPQRLPKPHPAARVAEAAGVPILSDVEFLYRAVLASHSKARFVGVTGTNGKSTTTALIHHLLTGAGRPSWPGATPGRRRSDSTYWGRRGSIPSKCRPTCWSELPRCASTWLLC